MTLDRNTVLSFLVLACGCTEHGESQQPLLLHDGGTEISSALPECAEGWCRISAGSFVMGSPPDEPGAAAKSEKQVHVTLTRSFLMGQHEVTQAEWMALGLPNPSTVASYGEDCTDDAMCPLGSVTWFEAVAFANLLSIKAGLPPCYELQDCTGEIGTGMTCAGATLTAPILYECAGYRLPSEAEWEYAARAGTTTAFYSGPIAADATEGVCAPEPSLDDAAWYCINAGESTHPVGQKIANPWGLHDVHGNVAEWVNSEYTGASLGPSPQTDPQGTLTSVSNRGLRGGLFNSWGIMCRSANRFSSGWEVHGPGGGFRLCRTLP